jgi:hypothetical protein
VIYEFLSVMGVDRAATWVGVIPDVLEEEMWGSQTDPIEEIILWSWEVDGS